MQRHSKGSEKLSSNAGNVSNSYRQTQSPTSSMSSPDIPITQTQNHPSPLKNGTTIQKSGPSTTWKHRTEKTKIIKLKPKPSIMLDAPPLEKASDSGQIVDPDSWCDPSSKANRTVKELTLPANLRSKRAARRKKWIWATITVERVEMIWSISAVTIAERGTRQP